MSRGRAKEKMQSKGQAARPSKHPAHMPTTDDEIKEKYLERAIRELNDLSRRLQNCDLCPRGGLMPVLGSGHPQANIFIVKLAPQPAEIEEGVAFYGRPGSALIKSFKRLSIDPMTVYGTLLVKCPVADVNLAADECIARVVEELAIVEPQMVVIMGEDAVQVFNETALPLAHELNYDPGVIQQLTPTASALTVPNIDKCLNEQSGKQEFWSAFKSLGDWYNDLPPY